MKDSLHPDLRKKIGSQRLVLNHAVKTVYQEKLGILNISHPAVH